MNHVISTLVSDEYQVLISDNVFYGMHLLKNQPEIVLVIIDIDFQLKESLEFIRHIDSSKVYKKPCIVLSDKKIKAELNNSLDGLIHDHFSKPFDPMEVSNSIKRANSLKKAERPQADLKSRSKNL